MIHDHIVVNLEIKHKDELDFPFSDMGFLYGYGLFESIRIHHGEPLLIREHCTRMRRGAIILDIPFLFSQDELCEKANELIEKNKVEKGTLNFYLTAGDKLSKSNTKEPLFMMVVRPLEEDDDEGIKIAIRQESFQRIPLDRFKTLSWYKNILEKQLVKDVDELVLFDKSKNILEATNANVFFVKKNFLFTPKSSVILQGITRQFLLNNQDKFGVEVIMQPIQLNEIDQFDEIFLTNTRRGIILIKGNETYPDLKSKEISESIRRTYQKLLKIDKK